MPVLLQHNPDAQFDSWLTVGPVSGGTTSLGSIGFEWASWSPEGELLEDNGAVFWSALPHPLPKTRISSNPTRPASVTPRARRMDPALGPAGAAPVTVAQVTVPTGAVFTASVGAQGRSVAGPDWQETGRNRYGVQGAHLNPLGLFLNPLGLFLRTFTLFI